MFFGIAMHENILIYREMARVSTRANDGDKHILDITSLLYHHNKLYSAADDGKIKVRTKN